MGSRSARGPQGGGVRALPGILLVAACIGCQGQNRNLGYPKRNKEVAVVSTASEAVVTTPNKPVKPKAPEGPYYAPYDDEEVF